MQQIFDSKGALKYSIQDTGGDTINVLDFRGSLLYRYNRSTNTTVDKNGSLFMRGNIVFDLK